MKYIYVRINSGMNLLLLLILNKALHMQPFFTNTVPLFFTLHLISPKCSCWVLPYQLLFLFRWFSRKDAPQVCPGKLMYNTYLTSRDVSIFRWFSFWLAPLVWSPISIPGYQLWAMYRISLCFRAGVSSENFRWNCRVFWNAMVFCVL